jgi:hypothetical protein
MMFLEPFCMTHSLVVADKILRATHERSKSKTMVRYAEEQSTFEAQALLRDAFINHKADAALAEGPHAPTTN